MEIKRNPFKIHQESNKPKTPFDALSEPKRSINPFQISKKPNVTTKPQTKFFDLLKSNDISRTSEFALDLNKQAIKKQKLEEPVEESEDDLEEDKENVKWIYIDSSWQIIEFDTYQTKEYQRDGSGRYPS